jgi:hypothetical protein
LTDDSSRRKGWQDEEDAERKARRTLGAIVITLVIVTSVYRILVLNKVQHTSLVFIGLPALAAFSLLYTRPQTAIGTINKVIALLLCLSGIVFGEGLVRILFAAPIFFLVGTILGWIVNRISGKRDPKDSSSGNWRGVVALAVIPLSAEGLAPALSFHREERVTVTLVVDAEPIDVRSALAATPNFGRALPRFFKLGFPTPMHTSGNGLDVGDERLVMFAHGGHHNGALVMRVAAADSASALFTVMSDSSYITHWLSWESAGVTWEPAGHGRTRVTWTLEYRRRLDPAWYFAPLERYGVGLAAGYLIETLATPQPLATR